MQFKLFTIAVWAFASTTYAAPASDADISSASAQAVIGYIQKITSLADKNANILSGPTILNAPVRHDLTIHYISVRKIP
jgi:hypothetical protein